MPIQNHRNSPHKVRVKYVIKKKILSKIDHEFKDICGEFRWF